MNTSPAPRPSLRFGVVTHAPNSWRFIDALVESGLPPAVIVAADPWGRRSAGPGRRRLFAKRVAKMVVRRRRVVEHHGTYYSAKRHGVPFIDGSEVDSAESLSRLRSLDLDYLFVYGFTILPESVFGLPQHGTINCHTALLPDGRGPEPSFWTIANRFDYAGITFHFIDAGVDTGPIIERHEVPMHPDEDRLAMRVRLFDIGVQLYVSLIHRLARGLRPTTTPNEGEASWIARRPNVDDLRIDLEGSAAEIVALVRASVGIGACRLDLGSGEALVVQAIRLGPASSDHDGRLVDELGNVTIRTRDDELVYLVTSSN